MERERLVAGLNACKDVVDFVNEAIRDDTNQKVIAHIERSIINMDAKGCDFYSYGRLKQDGVAKITDFSDNQSKAKQRYVFIFERILLICKKLKNEIFEFKASYVLSNYSIQDTQAESPTSTTKSTSTLNRLKSATRFDYNTFALVSSVNDHKIQIDLKSPAQKKIWKEAIEFSINKCNPAEGKARMHQLTYKTYEIPTESKTDRCKRDLHYECLNQAFCGQRHRSSESASISAASKAERYIAIQSIKSTDPEVLCFDLHEEIIITGVSENGMLIGRRAIYPGKSGFVSKHTVRPLSHLMAHRGSLASIGTLPNNAMNDTNGSLELNNSTNAFNESSDVTAQQPSTATTQPTNGIKILASKKISNHKSQVWDIKSYPWYFGIKERIQANEMLSGTPNGTFIVRLSQRENKYVISISFKGGCKHMKIETGEDPVLGKIFWLHELKHFISIPELIEYYHENCLSECFENIDTQLSKTLLRTRLYKVTHGYSRNSETNRYLTLKREDVVEVVETSGEENGWWKFQAGDQVGFFPMDYVEPIEDENENDDISMISNVENNGIENVGSGLTAC
uniref:Uncharacterized protein n=1 Tax=Panagrolaimus sp. PS1159 TaxID=55785 RepID=A0AC35FL68_9BILA